MEPLRSANSTVTCLRSPSSALLEVRIFSGEVSRRIGLGRNETWLSGGRPCYGIRALGTEFGRCG
jgi:hypothetical protein